MPSLGGVVHCRSRSRDLPRRRKASRRSCVSAVKCARDNRFARLVGQIAGETESVLYSVINDILVVPTIITPEAIVRSQANEQVALLKLEMVRYMLRLKTQKIATLLEPRTKSASTDRLLMLHRTF
jgi:hypothetical protein